MRDLPAGLAAALSAGATTLCHCWRVTRRDGAKLGFTDHDRDIGFDGTIFLAESGLTATSFDATLGLAVDTMDAHGALSHGSLTEEDLAAGLYDDATVELFRVDWTNPDNRVAIFKGSIGEVSRGDVAFTAELRGHAHRLNQPVGRVFSRPCDATLGDQRCTVDLEASAFRGTGAVSSVVDNRILTVTGIAGFAGDWFTQGRLAWTSGANDGLSIEVKSHKRLSAAHVTLELWEKAPRAIEAGDQFEVRAGCDKRFETCATKFDNALNHRGFPHMPGNDAAFSYAIEDEGSHDGGSFFN